jgi:hypothetical protein
MNAINWFEIPTTDLARAQRFYEIVLETKLRNEDFGPTPMCIFEVPAPGVAGALIFTADRKPSSEGTLVYLNTGGAMNACLARVTKAGGQVVMPRTDIGPPGFIALIRDPEGNVVGFHEER